MRIESLRLKNFRCFDEHEFSFHPQFNLIVGANGVGKSSILDALSISMATWFIGLRAKPDRRLIQVGEPFLKNVGSVRAPSLEEQYPVIVESRGVVLSQHISWSRSKESVEGNTRYGNARDLINLANEADNAVRSGSPIILPLISYYGTMRLWQEPRPMKIRARSLGTTGVKSKSHLSRLAGYRHSVDPRISARELIQWFATESWATFQERKETPALRLVKKAVLGCLEGGQDIYFDAKSEELLVTIKGFGVQPFFNLSDGQRNMLALVADIAQKAITLNPELGPMALKKTPGIVLIDELDLHLHPQWQRGIIEALRSTFPKIQFICTTHSPFLVQSLRSGEELILLDGRPMANLGDMPIEDIAKGVMGVSNTEVSSRYSNMKNVARNYLETLELAKISPEQKQADYKKRLAESIAPYADNPAYQAFLEMKRAAALGE